MKYSKKELEASIKGMQEVVDDPEVPDSIKDSIRPSLAEAKKLLGEVSGDKSQKSKVRSEKAPAVAKPLTARQKQTFKNIVNKNADLKKMYAGYSEAALRRDAGRGAKKPGKRISAAGNPYYEGRANRSDISSKAPHLAEGGIIVKQNSEGILSVRRKQDGAILSVGDETLSGKIISIQKDKRAQGGIAIELDHKGRFASINVVALKHEEVFPNFRISIDGEETTLDDFITTDEDPDVNSIADEDMDKVKDLKPGESVQIPSHAGWTTITRLKDEYAGGGHLGDDPVWHNVGLNRPPANFTPAAAKAFKEAIEELQLQDNDQEFSYYKNASAAMTSLVSIVSELLTTDDAMRAHQLLQEVGMYNFKTGSLVNTSFLNSELAARKLAGGGGFNQYGEPYGFPDDDEEEEKGGLPENYYVYDVYEERGHLMARVDDHLRNTVWSFDSDSMEEGESTPVEDGFLRNWNDIKGLEKYLKQMQVISKQASVISSKEATRRYDHYMKKGGRLKSAINRDRAYKSQEPWEQKYKRKGTPKNPKYKKEKGGPVKAKPITKPQSRKQSIKEGRRLARMAVKK